MLKAYGSMMCPDCFACNKNFDLYGIEYEFININGKLHDLSDFPVLRDSNPVFNSCRQIHHIGLPVFVKEDGTVFLNLECYLRDRGCMVIEEETAACSLDRKGC